MKPIYIGDGVYLSEGNSGPGSFMLTTGTHKENEADNVIFLDTLEALDLVRAMKDQIEKDGVALTTPTAPPKGTKADQFLALLSPILDKAELYDAPYCLMIGDFEKKGSLIRVDGPLDSIANDVLLFKRLLVDLHEIAAKQYPAIAESWERFKKDPGTKPQKN